MVKTTYIVLLELWQLVSYLVFLLIGQYKMQTDIKTLSWSNTGYIFNFQLTLVSRNHISEIISHGIDRIRILGIELELACTRGLHGGIFSHANSF